MVVEIAMHRGDLEIRKFVIKNPDGTAFTGVLDEIFLTVKRTTLDKAFLFQKRLTTGTIIPYGEGTYLFRIEPEETNGLVYGKYAFDIELLIEGELKKTFVGTLRLDPEVTYACNEGVEA